MIGLAQPPEWLRGTVQHKNSCWSAGAGLRQCEDGEAYWQPSGTVKDMVLCPGCASGFLTDRGHYSNGIRVLEYTWNPEKSARAQRVIPFAERPAVFGEICDMCADTGSYTLFIPELGGWVDLQGNDSLDKVWPTHLRELPPRVLQLIEDHGIDWDN